VKHRAVRLQIDQETRARDRRVLGRRLVESQSQETAQSQGIVGAPHNAALCINALKVPNQQQSEIGARCQSLPADRRRVERRTLRFDERVEAVRLEHLIQPLIEQVAGRWAAARWSRSTIRASVRGLFDDPWP